MATLTAKLTLTSSTATSDSLNLSATDTLTFSNDVIQKEWQLQRQQQYF